MTQTGIPASHADLLTKKALAHLVTLLPDGRPQYRYLEVRGRVVERTKKGAEQHIDALAKRYLGQDKYPFRKPTEERVIFKVQPERSTSM